MAADSLCSGILGESSHALTAVHRVVKASKLQSPSPRCDAVPAIAWQSVLDAVVPAIVALQVTAVRSFQDDQAGAHGGTGFVIDAARGLMLTNRHVCTCGPARAFATFVGCPSMEEVSVDIAYLDPVHDFAILRFDPEELQQTPSAEIALDPSGLRVGEEVRIVGNDSLEKLQILSGTIARVDRDPPDLAGDYHDENTFYALAASGTRGGSSGSPVLNRHGKAIALNAAAVNDTMHGFYLPLHRVAHALELIKTGQCVPRGTLCAQLSYTSFPECLRLGVAKDFMQQYIVGRDPPTGGTFDKATIPSGMLQVKRCIPGTAADKQLRPGDVLLELEGQPCVDFVFYDAALDHAVGKSVHLALCRGGQRVELDLEVRDLHNLIPHAWIELGLGVFHAVPYQTAHKHNIPLRGVYVAQAGFVFGEAVKSDAVILGVNGNACNDLRSLEDALQQIPEKEYFSVSWMLPKSATERKRRESLVKMQRQWCSFRVWSLDRATRMWSPRRLGLTALDTTGATHDDAGTVASDVASTIVVGKAESTEAEAPLAKKARKGCLAGAMGALSKSICTVVFRTVQNFNVDLVANMTGLENDVYSCIGSGVVLATGSEKETSFVLTDRTTVPQALGDIEVTLGDTIRGASVWFMHPNHSLVVLKLDPPTDGNDARFGEAAKFVDHALEAGEEVDLVGVDVQGRCSSSKVTVRRVGLGNFRRNWPPRWHERNLEAVTLTDEPENMNGGVLCSPEGHIYAMYGMAPSVGDGEVEHTGYGIPSHVVMPLHAQISGQCDNMKKPCIPSLEIQFRKVELSKLRRLPAQLRPSPEWLDQLKSVSLAFVEDAVELETGGWTLEVAGVAAGGPCDGLVSEGDLLVAVDGHTVASARAVETCLQDRGLHGEAGNPGAEVKLTLLRHGKQRDVVCRMALLGSDGARRLLCWHGLMLEEIPRSVRDYGSVPAGVHVSDMLLGSPSEADGIQGDFVLSANGEPLPNLDAVLALDRKWRKQAAAGAKRRRHHVRVETSDLSGRRFMKALEPVPLFWPTVEIVMDPQGVWSCVEHCD
jgi:S1-C subfamily serine protease